MLKYFLVAFAAVILTAIAQILLKMGALKTPKQTLWVKQYLNQYVFIGYSLFLIVTVMNLYAYKFLPLKYAIVLLPFTFIFITMFSLLFFKEPISKRQFISYLIIIIGVAVYNLY